MSSQIAYWFVRALVAEQAIAAIAFLIAGNYKMACYWAFATGITWTTLYF